MPHPITTRSAFNDFQACKLKPDPVGRGKTGILITLAGISQGDEV